MKVIRREWFDVTRPDTWTLYPLGDVHLGNAACDERAFRCVVDRIAKDDSALWVGMGDYADFINLSDKRFAAESLAGWIKGSDLADLARAERDRFLEIVAPIAGKCVGLVEGNHERAIVDHYERDIYSDIVTGVKEAAGWDADHQLAFGYSGWLLLSFFRSPSPVRKRGVRIKVNVHHGFVGGRLAGAKALNMQRWLWTHVCDLAIFGHSHNDMVQVEAVESTSGNRVVQHVRRGIYGGSFMAAARYAERKGYFPLPIAQPHVTLQPGAIAQKDRVQVVT